MTVNNTIGAAELLRKYLESPAGSDLLGEMVKMAAELLMDADVDVLCNAGYGERTEDRENSRNGHRSGGGTPAPARSASMSPSSATAATCPVSSSLDGESNRRSSRSSARPTSKASPRVASTIS